jgi:hypothetical protein
MLIDAGVPENVIIEVTGPINAAVIRIEDVDELRQTPCDFAVTELIKSGQLEVTSVEDGVVFIRPQKLDS